jgi:hypothetical protein
MSVNSRIRTIAGASAVMLLLAGAALAAVTATGSGTAQHAGAAKRLRAVRLREGGRDIATAATYLGVSAAQLQAQLRAGHSLAQLAQASSGHSVAGLIAALLASKRGHLEKSLAALPRRVRAEVERVGGPGTGLLGGGHLPRGRIRSLFAAPGYIALPIATYLGISTQALRSGLEAGRTLADLARANNRSEAGLVAAIVAARQRVLAALLQTGSISQTREQSLLATLQRRVQRLVRVSLVGPEAG